jgi:hypothetical protein
MKYNLSNLTIRYIIRDINLLLIPYKIISIILFYQGDVSTLALNISNIFFQIELGGPRVIYTDQCAPDNCNCLTYWNDCSFDNNETIFYRTNDIFMNDCFKFNVSTLSECGLPMISCVNINNSITYTIDPLVTLILSSSCCIIFLLFSIIRINIVDDNIRFKPFVSWRSNYEFDHYLFLLYTTPILCVNVILLLPNNCDYILSGSAPPSDYYGCYGSVECLIYSIDYYNYVMTISSIMLWFVGLHDLIKSILSFQYNWTSRVESSIGKIDINQLSDDDIRLLRNRISINK